MLEVVRVFSNFDAAEKSFLSDNHNQLSDPWMHEMYSSEKITDEKAISKPLSMPGAVQGKYLVMVQHHCRDMQVTTSETAGQFNIHINAH